MVMYYHVLNNIYVVRGAKYCCIYDLPNNRLHKITNLACDILDKVILGENILDIHEKKFMDSLVQLGVVHEVSSPILDYRSIEQDYSYERKIDFAWIEITNSCNLKCIHCYNEYASISKTMLSLDDFKYIVDQLCSVGIQKVQLIGGEPFVLKKETLYSMMDYLSTKVKSFEIFTNGTIATDEDWKEIKSRYDNISVATSLHSYIKNEHEYVTQIKGSFQKSENTIRILRTLNIPFRYVGTLIGGVNIGKTEELGAPSRRDFVRLSGKANLSLYDDKLLKERIITKESMHLGNLKDSIKSIYEENCFSTHLYIGSNLNVYPCPMERRLCHGNLKDVPLKKILKPQILNFSKKEVEGCKDCEYRYLCRDCRADSLNGDLREKPWYCTYNPYEGTWETFDEFKKRIL